ncbi:hypothetical protein XENTR_v10022118 [Xenopus tropicalis]|nr:hypothetical protein XENTR_v10022118 [Xenopus tropicalis]
MKLLIAHILSRRHIFLISIEHHVCSWHLSSTEDNGLRTIINKSPCSFFQQVLPAGFIHYVYTEQPPVCSCCRAALMNDCDKRP